MIKSCLHCGEDTKDLAQDFCCLGCDSAYKIIAAQGFENYYRLREIDPKIRKIKPESDSGFDVSPFVAEEKNQQFCVTLMVQGLHCAACVWLIESLLKKQKDVIDARINLSRKTLFLRFAGEKNYGNSLVKLIEEIGYKLLPFDIEILKTEEKKYDNSILLALAVAGFGMGNIMLFSLCLWFFGVENMGQNTRNLLHFFSSLIALPVIIFSARPFFTSAFRSVKAGFPNMDLAISIAIFLACVVSLFEAFRGGLHVYFDSVVMLIFFLLIGRYLDMKARKKAFSIVSEFSLLAASFGRVEIDGKIKILPIKELREGMILLAAAGERIAADGVIIEGESEVDMSIITGESLPKKLSPNSEIFAGTINQGAALKIRISKSNEDSLLAQIIRLSSEVENKKNHYVRLADRLAKIYLPGVHILALVTFIFWLKSGFEVALMNATAVLIITCPCALALAVPIVQTIAISNFIRRGILVKSGEALEKLQEISTIVFDKTGSLTLGEMQLREIFLLKNGVKILPSDEQKNFYLKLAASLAKSSNHPISQALVKNCSQDLYNLQAQEIRGFGLESVFENKVIKLGRGEFCGIKNSKNLLENFAKTFLKFGEDELVFFFDDVAKSDAAQTILALRNFGKKVILLSGDEENAVKKIAAQLQIDEFYFSKTPLEKAQFLENLKAKNQKFIMVGDGLNDAPALALSDVSISFSKAIDLSKNIADIVICGEKLMPILELIDSSKKSLSLMKQNLLIALIYNFLAVPFAVAGFVVPLFAALAMSSSSLLVLFNSFRMNR
jgi:Cu2+-exporting ATPase